jgi:uncharacterized protein with HEPN domain
MTLIDDLTRLKHMRDAAVDALSFTSGKTKEILENDKILSFAVVKVLEIIGEAASKISPECQAKYCDIPWGSMIGMRNRLVHAYYGINFDIVWKTITEDLEPLLNNLSNAITKEES